MNAKVDVAHEVGAEVEVLCAQPFDYETRAEREPKWMAGFRIAAIVGATDRDYRLDVIGEGTDRWGAQAGFRGAAPECVRAVYKTSEKYSHVGQNGAFANLGGAK